MLNIPTFEIIYLNLKYIRSDLRIFLFRFYLFIYLMCYAERKERDKENLNFFSPQVTDNVDCINQSLVCKKLKLPQILNLSLC